MNFYDQFDTSDDLYSDKLIKNHRKLRKIDRKIHRKVEREIDR